MQNFLLSKREDIKNVWYLTKTIFMCTVQCLIINICNMRPSNRNYPYKITS